MKTSILSLMLLPLIAGVGCAANRQYLALTSAVTHRWRLEGEITLYNSPIGTQSADFTVIRSANYGTRVELMGPAGTPIFFAFLQPNQFEIYSVPDGILIRDKPGPILAAAQKNLLALIATVFTATMDYLSGFAAPALFKGVPMQGGYRYQDAQTTIQWNERHGHLVQIVIRSGEATVFMDRRKKDGSYLVHFGDLLPVLRIKINYFEPDANLKGARWQLKIPPSSQVYSFSEYLRLQ